MLIYIIHENKLLRLLYRPAMWQFVYDNYGYQHLLAWIFILSMIVFVFALLCSIVYYETVKKLTIRICNKLYHIMAVIWDKIEKRILEIE